MKKSILNWIAVLISAIPAAYLAIIFPSLPQQVPLHFNGQLQADRVGDKSELWLVTAILSVVSIGVYFLITNLHRVDPKQKARPQQGSLQKLAFGLVVFLSVLNVVLISSSKNGLVLQSLLFPLLGLLFAFIGNYMNNIKPNYFAGIRLPWTLSDDENWRKTHHLAGKLWFAGGLLIAILSLALPLAWLMPFFIGITIILVAVPSIYSYRLFKNKTAHY